MNYLDYWTVVTTSYLDTLRRPTDLNQSDRSDLLCIYYFNDDTLHILNMVILNKIFVNYTNILKF